MKILIVRFSSIGDIVLTTPVVRACAQQIQNSEIHYLTKPSYTNLLVANPYIHRIWSLEKSFSTLTTALKAENFDVVVDLHNNLRTRRLCLSLGVKFLRFDKINLQKMLYVNKWLKHLPNVHIVDRYLQTVNSLGVVNDHQGLDFQIPMDLNVDSEISLNQSFVCIAIGGQHNTKKLPSQKLIDLCNLINHQIILIGGKEDVEDGKAIEDSCEHVTSLCGQLTINQSGLVLQKATAVVTHDTGMMHIASAMKKNIISIWGNTVPEFGMYPYLPGPHSKSFEVENLGCRPCSKIGFETCPNGHFKCMMNQDLRQIALSVNNLLLRKNH